MGIERTTSINASLAGLSISGTITRQGTNEVNADVNLPAGLAGTVTTKTDADTGTITVAATPAHGLVETDKVDIMWEGGIRRGMAVGAGVTATLVPVDTGTGTDLPIAGTTLVLSKQVSLDVDFTAASVVMAAAKAALRCSVQFQTNAGATVKELDLGSSGNANEVWEWHSDAGEATPFSGDVGKVVLGNGGTAENNFRFGALLSTPGGADLLRAGTRSRGGRQLSSWPAAPAPAGR